MSCYKNSISMNVGGYIIYIFLFVFALVSLQPFQRKKKKKENIFNKLKKNRTNNNMYIKYSKSNTGKKYKSNTHHPI